MEVQKEDRGVLTYHLEPARGGVVSSWMFSSAVIKTRMPCVLKRWGCVQILVTRWAKAGVLLPSRSKEASLVSLTPHFDPPVFDARQRRLGSIPVCACLCALIMKLLKEGRVVMTYQLEIAD
jgi:hypothetical protein